MNEQPTQRGGPTDDQQYILSVLEENGGEMGYKDLNDIVSERFDGLRLLLKKLKSIGYVDFEGIMPGFSSIISIVKS